MASPTCILCFTNLSMEKRWDFNLVEGKGSFKIKQALQLLSVVIGQTSEYICRSCLRLLKRIDSARLKLKELEDELVVKYREAATERGISVKTKCSKRALFVPECNVDKDDVVEGCADVSPNRPNDEIDKFTFLSPLSKTWSTEYPLASTPRAKKTKPNNTPNLSDSSVAETSVSIKVVWKSKTIKRQIPQDLKSVGLMLCRGTYKQLATAAWKHSALRPQIIELFLKEIDRECIRLCADKIKPSHSKRSAKILENCPAKKVSAEKQEKNAPSCLRLTSKEEILGFTFEKFDEELTNRAPLMRSALMAISRRRSKKKDDDLFFTPAVCMAAAVCLKNRSRRLTAVQLILTLMMRHSGFMATLIRLGALRLTVSHTFLYKKLDEYGKGHLDAILKQVDADGKRLDHIPAPNQAVIPDIGRKVVIDNFNYTAQPHEMTLERQNDCVNWVAMLITENRVSGYGLDDRKPDIAKIFTVPNAIFLPDEIERNNQRKDYIALVGRQAVKHVKCLQFLEDVATKHIQHKYSSIMTKSTNTTFAEMIYSNENESSVMQELENGFTDKERLEGLHMEIADFHGGMKFLQLIFDNFYCPKPSTDKCTMFSDKVLLNRRNINTDVSRKVSGCKNVFVLEINARIIAGLCQVLDIASPNDSPANEQELERLKTASNQEKRDYLNKISAEIVDQFVVKKENQLHLLQKQSYEDWLSATNNKNGQGLYKCRHNECHQTFKFDGKRRILHEKMHGLHKELDAQPAADKADDVKCLLSPKDAHRLVWNRFHKGSFAQGGNIPLDLALEHYNNIMKSIVKNLGPNSTNPKCMNRFCRALTVNKKLLDTFDKTCNIIKRSGKHIKAKETNDLLQVINELLINNAMKLKPGRTYHTHSGVEANLLTNFDVHGLYQWIETHKKVIRLHKSGR
eukprot:gene1821-2045_t